MIRLHKTNNTYKMRKNILFFIAIISILTACSSDKKAKYVFLFIGDGMGLNQVYTTELYLSAQNDQVKDTNLIFNTFPVSSNMTTFSKNAYVTCSSAAGTALSTGFKTNNGVLGKSPDLEENYETFSVKAKQLGYKVGILSSVAIDHATPAAFYAHQDSRSMYYEISMELPDYDIDYFGGGGFHFPKGRGDSLPDAYENAISKGYTLVNTYDDFAGLKNGDEKVFAINPVTYPRGEMHWAIDKKENEMSLADITENAIDVLKGDKGFFMMVEGGKIDWACHANDAASMIHEVISFNEAVEKAYEFYKEYPDETLIIVTADHETGSLYSGIKYSMNPQLLKHQKISGQEFERIMVNLKESTQDVSFSQVLDSINTYFGLGDTTINLDLSTEDTDLLKSAFNNEFELENEVDPDADYLATSNVLSVAEAAIKILNTKAGYGWGSTDHSSAPVPVRVIGAGQEHFTNYFDNTELRGLMLKAMSK